LYIYHWTRHVTANEAGKDVRIKLSKIVLFTSYSLCPLLPASNLLQGKASIEDDHNCIQNRIQIQIIYLNRRASL